MIMERLISSVGKCTYLFVPNAHQPTRNILAFSGLVNEDNDHYFDDPLFPRIDEDLKKQMTDDDESGIENIDDDGDGQVDEGDKNDDDEDGQEDEDPIDNQPSWFFFVSIFLVLIVIGMILILKLIV